MQDKIPELLSLKEACEVLKCHPNTLRKWDNEGILKAVRIGKRGTRKYRKSDILRLLNNDIAHPNRSIQSEDNLSLYREIADSVPAMVGVYDITTGEYMYVNRSVTKLLGYVPADFTSKGLQFVSSLVHPDDVDRVMHDNSKALEEANRKVHTPDEDPIVTFEYRMKHKDGSWRWLHTDGSVFSRDDMGKVRVVLNVSVDITRRKEAEQRLEILSDQLGTRVQERTEQLEKTEERYKQFVNLSSEGIWRFELEKPLSITLSPKKQIDHMYTYAYLAECNDAMAKMYGYKNSAEIIGGRLGDFLIKSDKNNIDYLTAFIKSGYRLQNTESHELDRFGKLRFFSNSLTGHVESGFLKRAWGLQREITEQKQMDEKMQKLNDKLQSEVATLNTFFDLLPIGLAIAPDPDCENVRINKQHASMLGIARNVNASIKAFKKGKAPWKTFRNGKLLTPEERLLEMSITQKKTFSNIEQTYVRNDGKSVDVLAYAAPLIDNGVVKGAIGAYLDITKQKASQKELEEIRLNYRRLFDSSIIGIVIAGFKGASSGKFIDANNFFCKSFGYSRKDIKDGKVRWDEITPKAYRKLDVKALGELRMYGECEPYEKEYINSAGKRIPIYLGIAAIPGTEYCIAYILDISQRKELEYQKDETLRILELLLNSAPVGIFQTDASGNCTYVNKKWCEFAGFTAEQALGQGWVNALHPEDKDRLFREWYAAAKSNTDFNSDYRFRTAEGKITWLHGVSTSVQDNKGKIIGYLGTVSDITERKNRSEKLFPRFTFPQNSMLFCCPLDLFNYFFYQLIKIKIFFLKYKFSALNFCNI